MTIILREGDQHHLLNAVDTDQRYPDIRRWPYTNSSNPMSAMPGQLPVMDVSWVRAFHLLSYDYKRDVRLQGIEEEVKQLQRSQSKNEEQFLDLT